MFTGSVTFEEQGLQASGAEARYEPNEGRLRLTGTDAGGPPRVTDDADHDRGAAEHRRDARRRGA